MARRADENTIYSAIVRRGPDISHYDVSFEGRRIVFRYLGEHWESFRPRTGLQKRMDLYVYSMRKKRRRQSGDVKLPEDFDIDICSIKSVELVKMPEKGIGKIVIRTREPQVGVVEVEYPLKIHEIAKTIYKKVLRVLEECGKG